MKRFLLLLISAGVVWAACTSFVMVDETEYVIVERLGRIQSVYDLPSHKGAHFKFPWPVDSVRRFDSRIQLYDPPARELFTRDKKNITVDTFVCWKIKERHSSTTMTYSPTVNFFRSLGTQSVANARLDSQLRSVLTAQIGRVALDELLTAQTSEQGPDANTNGPFAELSARLLQELQATTDDRLGIEILDVRIKRLNFPTGNQQAVYERMISERSKIANRYRAAGLAENQVIKSRADRRYNEILARAQGDATRIRGAAEAQSIQTLQSAYAADPEFFETLRILDSYERILGGKTTLVLSASSRLFRVLRDGTQTTAPNGSPDSSPTKVAPAGSSTDSSSQPATDAATENGRDDSPESGS